MQRLGAQKPESLQGARKNHGVGGINVRFLHANSQLRDDAGYGVTAPTEVS